MAYAQGIRCVLQPVLEEGLNVLMGTRESVMARLLSDRTIKLARGRVVWTADAGLVATAELAKDPSAS